MGEVRLRIIKGMKHQRLEQKAEAKGEGKSAVTEITCMRASMQ